VNRHKLEELLRQHKTAALHAKFSVDRARLIVIMVNQTAQRHLLLVSWCDRTARRCCRCHQPVGDDRDSHTLTHYDSPAAPTLKI